MERKTIGNLIGVLRRANGMTQRELAERLGVTDKTISHWECDETLPDLTLIPLLAEIFGVSCDELLRGEINAPGVNKAAAEDDGREAQRACRQARALIDHQSSRFTVKSLIAAGIAALGFLCAILINFGFLRAYIAFSVCAILVCGAVVTQCAFLISAFGSLGRWEDPFMEEYRELINDARRKFIRCSTAVISFALVILFFCMPLLIDVSDAYVGLTADPFFLHGLILGLLVAAPCFLIGRMVARLPLGSKASLSTESDPKAKRQVKRLGIRLSAILAAVVLLTVVLNVVIRNWLPDWLCPPNVMKEESFIKYSFEITDGQELPEDLPEEIADRIKKELGYRLETADDPEATITGKVISIPEQAERYTAFEFSEDVPVIPVVTIWTDQEILKIERINKWISTVFLLIYLTEAAFFTLLFLKKRTLLLQETAEQKQPLSQEETA